MASPDHKELKKWDLDSMATLTTRYKRYRITKMCVMSIKKSLKGKSLGDV